MKDARELLVKLRAAGVEPVSDEDVQQILSGFPGRWRNPFEWPVKLAADLLEARAKLAEVREWAEQYASEPAESGVQAVGRLCGEEVLEILDREPEP